MTLPVALLIARYKQEINQDEIREILDENDILELESLSCNCRRHIKSEQLMPPNVDCLFNSASPTSDLGSEISDSTITSGYTYIQKSYSLFSNGNKNQKNNTPNRLETEQTDDDIAEYLSVVLDLIENVNVRFMNSYMFTENKEVKIHYNGRDILDLGKNLQGDFKLTHPKAEYKYPPPKFACFKTVCPENGCGFVDIFPSKLT